jgi:hypothetical protein
MNPGRLIWKNWRRRSRLERGVAAFVLLVCVAVVALSPGEPWHGGRPLSSWINEYEETKSPRAREAISAIGERALPLVYRGFDTNRINLSPTVPYSKVLAEFWNDSRWELQIRDALTVLEVLGPRAKETLPMLRRRLNEVGFHGAARAGIVYVEGDVGETFAWTMKNGNLFSKRMMIGWVRNQKWEPQVFDLLSEARTNVDFQLRSWAYATLLHGDLEPETHRQFVLEGLTNSLGGVRQVTLDYLARNPEEVSNYVSQVQELTNNKLNKKTALSALKAAGLISKEAGKGIIVPKPDDRKKMAER